jgi:hypothetical protein
MKQQTTASASPEPLAISIQPSQTVANIGLCFRHVALRNAQSDSADLRSAFGDKPSEFNTCVEVRDFIAKLTALLVQGRISCRRASVLASAASSFSAHSPLLTKAQTDKIEFWSSPMARRERLEAPTSPRAIPSSRKPQNDLCTSPELWPM